MKDLCVLPQMAACFDVERAVTVRAVEQAMAQDQRIFLVAQRSADKDDFTRDDLYEYGTVSEIRQVIKLSGGGLRVLVDGQVRAVLLDMWPADGYMQGRVRLEPMDTKLTVNASEAEAMRRLLLEYVDEYDRHNPSFSHENALLLKEEKALVNLLSGISAAIPFSTEERQSILETQTVAERYELTALYLGRETEVGRIKRELQSKVKYRIDKNQKEFILREEMKVINEELGENTIQAEAQASEEALCRLKASGQVKESIQKEIDRYRTMQTGSQEAYVLKNHIDTLLEMPWNRQTKENKDLARTEQILEEDHYGLTDVKERVMEYLAVRALTGKGESPILCLVGPPGTGKTSIARSIARALNRKYVRICLGGLRDEAELRGHRRTYIGAMPGRIALALKQAKSANPLILLDEIDKVGSDYKGDPYAALLEILDSAQNNSFRDNYIELPIDLSKVLFVATANTVQNIPRPLLDRMEVIEVSGYTENEKLHIAMQYLIKKQFEANGLTADMLEITEDAVKDIIHYYTREAGVRQLERKIGALCRKAGREILGGRTGKILIDSGDLEEYLGIRIYRTAPGENEDAVGVVHGLAWTQAGGETLEVEASLMPGTGKLKLTGQMGDVMKESAYTALSYVRSVSPGYNVLADVYEKNDIHIHIPEGAVPKDGPSAGITMATAMMSAVTNMKVRGDVAMTGEITLRGRVLPIGGLKEKLLAARMSDIHTVIVPGTNRANVQELPDEILEGMDIKYAASMDEVLREALIQ